MTRPDISGFPDCLFEVEHSTNFVNAMTKFCELQDFHVKCYCVAEDSRRDKFERELNKSAFLSIPKPNYQAIVILEYLSLWTEAWR